MDASKLQTEVVAGVHLIEERSLENPGVPLSMGAGVDYYGTQSGVPVSHYSSLSYVPVWSCVNMMSTDLARMALQVHEYRPEISHTASEVVETELGWVFRRPNEMLAGYEFWKRTYMHMLIWGTAYVLPRFDNAGRTVELYHLLPDRTAPVITETEAGLYYQSEIDGELYTFRPDDLLVFQWLSSVQQKHAESYDPTVMARDAWALGLAQEQFSSKFFRYGARVGGILEVPQAMSKKGRDTLETGFRSAYEDSSKPFKTIVLRDGAKFHEAQRSPEQSQLTEASEAQVRQVARFYGIPPSKLGVADARSYNSKTEDQSAYVEALAPFSEAVASECTAKLISAANRRRRFVQANPEGLVKLNYSAMIDVLGNAISSRIINPNEARAKLGLSPYEGGDEFINPNTTSSVVQEGDEASASSGEPPSGSPSGDGGGEESQGDSENAERSASEVLRARVLFYATSRVRHKASQSHKSWIDFQKRGFEAVNEYASTILGTDAILEPLWAALTAVRHGEGQYDHADRICTEYEQGTL